MPYTPPSTTSVSNNLIIPPRTSREGSISTETSSSSSRDGRRPKAVSKVKTTFFLFDEEDNDEKTEDKKLPNSHVVAVRNSSQGSNKLSAQKPMAAIDMSQILKFPTESTHAYSYARLSPNSLALRLDVLKKSLELIIERPDTFHDREKEDAVKMASALPKPPKFSLERNENYKLQTNASNAALSALFRAPPQDIPNSPIIKARESPSQAYSLLNSEISTYNEGFNDELKEIIKLLDISSEKIATIDSNVSQTEVALSLHNLSLSNGDTSELKMSSNGYLRIRLLHALATPFVESSLSTPLISLQNGASTLVLSSLNNGQNSSPTTHHPIGNNNNRPFHNISSGKNSVPQAVFTVSLDNPWPLKAANDLAYLMFGVSRTVLRSLTLMDLIAPHSRTFVMDKLTNSDSNIIFAGEIIAVSRPGGGFAWTSMWAKKKDNLMICMFDQIPCDSVDVVIEKDEKNININSMVQNSGRVFEGVKSQCKQLVDLCPSLNAQLLLENTEASEYPVDEEYSDLVNKTRYYTLKLNGAHVPCAITSNVLDSDNNSLVKLKIHSMPYIAGMFVISSKDLTIMSFNTAIAKNMFGQGEILNKSVDSILPKFSAILHRGIEETGFTPETGLVLPEHFFRKYDAILNAARSGGDPEPLFLESSGIYGRHRDGYLIKVDVQLRVSSPDSYILWITFSRQSDSRRAAKGVGSKSTNSSEDPDLPSQLDLFPEDENDLLSLGSDGTPLSRESSIHKHRNITESLMLSSDSLERELNVRSKRSTATSDDCPKPNRVPSLSNSVSESDKSMSTRPTTMSVAPGFINSSAYSEDKVLKSESEKLSKVISKSTKWPKSVGIARRSKKFSEFTIIKNMGVGAYGKVVLVEHKEDPYYKVIIKCIDKEKILVDTWVRDRKLGTIPSEIQIMAFLNNDPHPNIMRIVDFFEDEKYYYLETPLHGNPPAIDLFDFIEIKQTINDLECRFIFRQIASALAHLHKNEIVHRDIKDENVIVDEHGLVKLIDFGSAAYTKSGPFDVFVGTIDYAAPEVLNGDSYKGKPQDIWALGILLYTLIYKENPFYNVDEIMEGELRIPFVPSEECVSLIKQILVRDIKHRPPIEEILKHTWLTL